MDPATLAALCLLSTRDPKAYPPLAAPAICGEGGHAVQARVELALAARLNQLRAIVGTAHARDAMARTVIAEAGDQGDSGMAGVAFTILNRLADGRWGGTVEAVVDAPGQFEPVTRAGGSWRSLPPVSAAQEARVNTIVNLALDGRLPDLTGGASYFQNPQIVAARARVGTVSSSLVNFRGAMPSAVIGAHVFYAAPARTGRGSEKRPRVGAPASPGTSAGEIFVGENRIVQLPDTTKPSQASGDPSTGAGDGGGAIFVP